jgi:hypothetical protein
MDLTERKKQEVGRYCIMKTLLIFYLRQILRKQMKSRRIKWTGMYKTGDRTSMLYIVAVTKTGVNKPLTRCRLR